MVCNHIKNFYHNIFLNSACSSLLDGQYNKVDKDDEVDKDDKVDKDNDNKEEEDMHKKEKEEFFCKNSYNDQIWWG